MLRANGSVVSLERRVGPARRETSRTSSSSVRLLGVSRVNLDSVALSHQNLDLSASVGARWTTVQTEARVFRFLIVITLLALILPPAQAAAGPCVDDAGVGATRLCGTVSGDAGMCPDTGGEQGDDSGGCEHEYCAGGALATVADVARQAAIGRQRLRPPTGARVPARVPLRLLRPPIS